MKTTFASNIKKTAAAFACALTVFTAAASSTVGASEYFYHEYNGYPASDQTVCCFYTPGYSSLKFVVEDGSKTIDHNETVNDDGTASIREITTVYYNDRTEKTTVTIKETYNFYDSTVTTEKSTDKTTYYDNSNVVYSSDTAVFTETSYDFAFRKNSEYNSEKALIRQARANGTLSEYYHSDTDIDGNTITLFN